MTLSAKVLKDIASQKTGNYILTMDRTREITGCFNYDDLENPEQYRLLDILYALESMPRYAGFTRIPYSVAKHSILVLRLAEMELKNLPKNQALGLLSHDFMEAYMADLCTPVKRKLMDYKELETKGTLTINWILGCLDVDHDFIKEYDLKALKIEAQALLNMTEVEVEMAFPSTRGVDVSSHKDFADWWFFDPSTAYNLVDRNAGSQLALHLGRYGVSVD